MEDGLVPEKLKDAVKEVFAQVLILVVMEDGLVQRCS